jgi:hypothetical protein
MINKKIDEAEARAWKSLNRSLGGVIWSHCDMCKSFVVGTILGFATCLILIAIL